MALDGAGAACSASPSKCVPGACPQKQLELDRGVIGHMSRHGLPHVERRTVYCRWTRPRRRALYKPIHGHVHFTQDQPRFQGLESRVLLLIGTLKTRSSLSWL